jgi:hypothetical protein
MKAMPHPQLQMIAGASVTGSTGRPSLDLASTDLGS